MKNSLHILMILSILSLLTSMAAAQEKVYSCSRLTQEPKMDGDVQNDPAWKNIVADSDFHKLNTKDPAPKATSFRIGYTPDALFLGIVCQEADMPKIRSQLKNGGDVWDQDSLEIFLQPANSSHYYHFVIDTDSGRCNGFDNEQYCTKLWNWESTVYKGENYYSVEIRLSFESIKELPEKNAAWRVNICRNITVPQGANECWANVIVNYHDPKNFGKIIFQENILPEEGSATKNAIVLSLNDETLLNLKQARTVERFGTRKYDAKLEQEKRDLISQINMINHNVSQGQNLTVSEARLFYNKSYDLIGISDDLKLKMGLAALLNE